MFDHNVDTKPKFDPNKKYTPISEMNKPLFDANKPFKKKDETGSTDSLVSNGSPTQSNVGVNIDPSKYETKLSPQDEVKFQGWLDQNYKSGKIQKGDYEFYKKNGYGYDYDFRAAFEAGVKPEINKEDGKWHWNDIGKKPNEPTFSNQSKYNGVDGFIGGTWDGDKFIPAKKITTAQPQRDPLKNIIDIADQSDNTNIGITDTINDKTTIQQAPNILKQSTSDKIKSGDVDAITGTVSSRLAAIQLKLDNAKNNADGMIAAFTGGTPDSDLYKQYEQQVTQLSKEKSDLIGDGAFVLQKVYSDKWDASDKSDTTRKALGEELRSSLEKIGDVNQFSEQKRLVDLKNKQITYKPIDDVFRQRAIQLGLGDKVAPIKSISTAAKYGNESLSATLHSATLDKNSEYYSYSNEGAILTAVINKKSDDIEKAKFDPVVQQYINGTAEEKQKLQSSPEIINYNSLVNDGKSAVAQMRGLADKYPQVKIDIVRQKIADTFADMVKTRSLVANIVAPGGFDALNIFVGNKLSSDEDIKTVAKLSGLSEDEVRANADAASIPSYIGYAVREFGSSLFSSLQGLNRLTLSPTDADLQNTILEQSKYNLPKSFQLSKSNVNPQSILYSAFGGTGNVAEFAAESWLTGELLGGLSGISKVGRLAAEDLKVMNTAEKILPIENFADVVKNLGLADTKEEALTSMVNGVNKAKNFAGAYTSAFLPSYEDAYKEAAQYTSDESKRKKFAGQVATANGLSMLVFNASEYAQNILKDASKTELVNSFLESKTPFSDENPIMSRLGNAAKTLGLVNVQQMIPLIADTISKSNVLDYHTSTSEFTNNVLDGIMKSSISMLPLVALGSSKGASSELLKQSLFEAGQSRDLLNQRIEDDFNSDVIDNTEKNRRIKIVNTLSDLVKNVPDKIGDRTLTQPEKNELVYQQLQHSLLTDEKEKSSDALKKFYDQDLKAVTENIDGVINPKPFTPQETISDAANKGTFTGVEGEMIKDGSMTPDQAILELAKQKHGISDDGSEVEGGGRDISMKTSTAVDDAVTKVFPDKQSVIDHIKNSQNEETQNADQTGQAQKTKVLGTEGAEAGTGEAPFRSDDEIDKMLKDSESITASQRRVPRNVEDPVSGKQKMSVKNMRDRIELLKNIINCLT